MPTACIIDGFSGCMLNSWDSQLFHKFFAMNNWKVVSDWKDADLVLLNTCAFVKSVEDKVAQRIIEIKAGLRPDQRMVVAGCFPKINDERLREIFEGVSFGPRENTQLNKIIDAQVKIEDVRINRLEEQYLNGAPSSRFYIKIEDGCLGNCSFCAIKAAKGNLKSIEPERILEQFRKGREVGYKEFVLLGDDIGCYGRDIRTNLVELLKRIVQQDGEFYLFLHFVQPNWFLDMIDGFRDVFATGKVTVLNIPIQSGNDRVLRLMRRPYSMKEVLPVMQKIKAEFPSVLLQTHVIVGFPGETYAEFLDSLEAAKYFDVVKFFGFSERPGRKSVLSSEAKLHRQAAFGLIEGQIEEGKGTYLIVQG